MMIYTPPIFMAENTTITLTISQLAKLGCDQSVVASWEQFLADLGFDPEDIAFVDGFDINNTSTYAAFGFDLSDSSTWEAVIDWDNLGG